MRPGDADFTYRGFIAGERRAPMENLRGTTGCADILEAVSDAFHEENGHILEWCGEIFEPEDLEERLLRTNSATRTLHEPSLFRMYKTVMSGYVYILGRGIRGHNRT